MLQSSVLKVALKCCAHPVSTSPLPPWTFDCIGCIVHSLDGSAYLLPVRGKGQHSEVNIIHKKHKKKHSRETLDKTDWNALTSVTKRTSLWGTKQVCCHFIALDFFLKKVSFSPLSFILCILLSSLHNREWTSVKICRVTVCAAHYPVLPYPTTQKYPPDLRMLPGQGNKEHAHIHT